jgi:hypothetical protein
MGWLSANRYTSVEIPLTQRWRGREAPRSTRGPWYVPPALRGTGPNSRHARLRVAGAGVAAVAAAALLSACGGGSSSATSQAAGTYRLRVAAAQFPTAQRLGQTSLLRLGVQNTGARTVPDLSVTVSIAGRAGATSSLPFGIHDPQPGLAQPDRPVWVLAQGYPRPIGSTAPNGGATTSNPKTFAFGPLRPGASQEAIWKLSAVRAGRYVVLYRIDADLSGTTKAVGPGGLPAGGSFAVAVSSEPPTTEVKDNGEVVEIGRGLSHSH